MAGENISFVNLKVATAIELDIDQIRKRMVIGYVDESIASLIVIRNYMDLKLYL